MQSLILNNAARLFFVAMAAGSIFILLRGHNEPGGGFIGGLVMSAGFAVLALAFGVPTARRALIMHPVALAGLGLVLGIVSGFFAFLEPGGAPFLTHQWATVSLGITELKLGTTIIFDVGVFFAVVGSVLAILFRLHDEGSAA